jgi:hypothetical protein
MTYTHLFLVAGLTLALALALSAESAQASSPLSAVGGAVVNKGALSIEQRFGYARDGESAELNRRFRMRQHMDYGVTDSYAFRISTEQQNRFGDNTEHQRVTIENRVQLFEADRDGWNGGFRLIYTHADNDKRPHELEFRLLSAVPFGDHWEWRTDQVFERELGPNNRNGMGYEFRSQITKAFHPYGNAMVERWRLGVDLFSDFDDTSAVGGGYSSQTHQFGPVAIIQLRNGAFMQTGYRAGISKQSADHLYKLFVGWTF